MKVYTINAEHERVYRGAILDGQPGLKVNLFLGGGSCGKKIPMFRKNQAEVRRDLHYGGDLFEAHPVQIQDGWALAKPNHESDQILVFVNTEGQSGGDGTGNWWFDRDTSTTRLTINPARQVLARATGPRDWFANQHDHKNIAWHDALVVMNVGDVICAVDRHGRETHARYESVEKGLVKL